MAFCKLAAGCVFDQSHFVPVLWFVQLAGCENCELATLKVE